MDGGFACSPLKIKHLTNKVGKNFMCLCKVFQIFCKEIVRYPLQTLPVAT